MKEPLRPAVPTPMRRRFDLARLRMESLRLAAGVIESIARGSSAPPVSSSSFREKPARDLDAANRALAPCAPNSAMALWCKQN